MVEEQQVTAGDVARWMADQIAEHGLLDQAAAAETIGRTFGTAFVYENRNGTWAIARHVLAAFRKLTADTVVWERSAQLWRHRMPSDPPGRRQVDWAGYARPVQPPGRRAGHVEQVGAASSSRLWRTADHLSRSLP